MKFIGDFILVFMIFFQIFFNMYVLLCNHGGNFF